MTYYMFAFVIPLLFLLMLGVLWMVPMKIKLQIKIFTVVEILNAWAILDVFVVSIVAGLLEIRQFVKYVIGDKCDLINSWLQVLDDYNLINLDGDITCFDVKTELLSGCILLFISALFYFGLGTWILRKCQSELEARKCNHV